MKKCPKFKKSTELSYSMIIYIWLLVDAYFGVSIFSLCGFLLLYLCSELTGKHSYNLISYFNYNAALQ